MERNRQQPPDVETALSSMLWTPYETTPSMSSEDDDLSLSSTINNQNSIQMNSNILYPYMTTEKHLYPQPIRYRYSNYFPFLSKQQNHQQNLPSYENFEKEHLEYNITKIGANGIYLIPQYQTSMVHSFTDDFMKYKVIVLLLFNCC